MLTKEQLEVRRSGVGASESAAVMGLSPWQSPLGVWMRKTGMTEDEPNEAMEAGSFLESGIARWYAHMTGAKLELCNRTLRHPKHKYLLATPDRFIVDDGRRRLGSLEIKDVGWFDDDVWGPEDSDQVPVYYLIQVAQQLAVTGLPYGKLVAFFHDRRRRPRVYHIDRNAKLEAQIIEIVGEFWNDHVVPRVAPEIDGSEAAKTFLKRIHAEHTEEIVDADWEAEKWAKQYWAASEEVKVAEARKDEAGNMLKSHVANRAGIRGPWGTATWKMSDGSGTDWKELALHALRGLGLGGHDVGAMIAQHQAPGSRRLNVRKPKKKG